MIFRFFRRSMSTSEAGKLGAAVKRERQREAYKRFHDEMAARAGTVIRWAD